MRKPRKNYTPVEKVAILRRHLIDRVPVSDLCDEYELSPTLFCLWQKQFFENGPTALERKNATPEGHLQRTIAALRDKLQGKTEVVADLINGNFSKTPAKPRPDRSARNGSVTNKHRGLDPAFKRPRRLGPAAAWLGFSWLRPPLPSGGSDPPAAGSDPGRARDLEDTPRS